MIMGITRALFYGSCRHLWLLVVCSAAILVSPAQAGDFREEFPPIYTETPTGVNIQTGRFRYQLYSLDIGPFSVTRGPGKSGFNLPGRLYWLSRPTFGGGTMVLVTIRFGDTPLDFQYIYNSGNPLFWPWSAGARGWKLERIAGTFYLTNKLGDVFTYTGHPALPQTGYGDTNKIPIQANYADGHRLDYTHDAQARTRTIISSRGYALVQDYDGNGNLGTICGYNTAVTFVDANSNCTASPLKVGFQYTLNGFGTYWLTSITDVSGVVTTISYHANSLVNCISLPGLPTCEIQNEQYGVLAGEPVGAYKADQVRRQSTASGAVWIFDYTNPPSPGGDDPPPQPGETRLTYAWFSGPAGLFADAVYANGFVKTLTSSSGYGAYEYNGVDPSKVTFVEGNAIEFQRDHAGNAMSRTMRPKPGSPLAPVTVTQAFPATNAYSSPTICNAVSEKLCTKPIYRIDERGYQTDFTYDPAHGGVLTEMGPAVGGVRPQTRYTYAQRYAWVKNAGGAFVQAAAPIWVLTQKSFCKTGAASGPGCAIGGDEVVTTYDYGPNSGPNNLLLRGMVDDATGAVLRTCQGHDWQGNKVSETKPLANLASCP